MIAPSLCGGFLSDKRALVAFTWTIATVMTLLAFLLAVILTCQVHAHYMRMERYYESQLTDDYYQRNNDGCEEEEGGEGEDEGEGEEEGCNHGSQDQNSADRQIEYLMQLASISSNSMTFVALYTMAMAVALSLFGSTAIVGFTSLRGDYIAPCFSTTGSSKLRLGIFGGAIVIFANLLLVCAVVFGEVRVEDWRQDGREGEDNKTEPYEIERLATVLAVTCMFLAALYTVFSVLLFLYFGNEEIDENTLDQTTTHTNKPLVTISNDLRTDKFITMEENST
ncbi:expressed unknown protein [Seminavis robusta]|uniref:Uncharacterized protein n=1 Tax=Seminavis robusta TaxID=568900 RepID=A0A9N8DF00_9STRA|nr:expressed unknown protein [Seminavis robusta]|eukprot:Sro63_g035810.1 n/a (281) ;mRNA; r:65584-66511